MIGIYIPIMRGGSREEGLAPHLDTVIRGLLIKGLKGAKPLLNTLIDRVTI